MNVNACNYDPLATDDDGMCGELVGAACDDMNANTENDAIEAGCGCSGTCIDDADADGVCDQDEVVGCQDESACNFDPTATDNDVELCTYAEDFYDCDGNCLNDADADGVCDELEVAGAPTKMHATTTSWPPTTTCPASCQGTCVTTWMRKRSTIP